LRDGEVLAGLRIRLSRSAVVSGIVRDHTGEPVRNLRVFVTRTEGALATAQGSDESAKVPTATTDSRGAYRIHGLPPGSYIVGAIPPAMFNTQGLFLETKEHVDAALKALERSSRQAIDSATTQVAKRHAYVPVFFPSSLTANQAVSVNVSAGEEARDVNLTLTPVPVVTVAGTLIGHGQLGSNFSLRMLKPGPRLPVGWGFEPDLVQDPSSDGQFLFTNVGPGSYTLVAKSTARVVQSSGPIRTVTGRIGDLPPGPVYCGTAVVDIPPNGLDLAGITVALRRCPEMTGRIVFESSTNQSTMTTNVRLGLEPILSNPGTRENPGLFIAEPATGDVASDGTFALRGLMSGMYALSGSVSSPDKVWRLRSAIKNGRDLLDSPIQVLGDDILDVVLTFSDRRSTVTGTLLDTNNTPASGAFVILFPQDRQLWSSARRVLASRSASNGSFLFTGMPAGEYQLAVTRGLPLEWNSARWLVGLLSNSLTVHVSEGGTVIQDLRMGRNNP
jgi:hypothetical protein